MKKANATPIITLTTDFGDDLYVAQIKGVILSINRKVKIVDIKHNVTSYSILEAAFLISQTYPSFPRDTIHLAVIDPGVGTSRGSLLIQTQNYFFIGPDNGLFSLILKEQKLKKIFEVDAAKFKPVSPTFHGRDIFAPLAAYISLGKEPEEFGRRIQKIVELEMKRNSIIYIDGFGNIITGIKKDFPIGEELMVRHKKRKIVARFVRTFAEAKRDEFILLRGSSGYLELDKNLSSAARQLRTRVGDPIEIIKREPAEVRRSNRL
jgi:hypothetical protein